MARNVTLINGFEGGTLGATVSAFNSGGLSGVPWDSTTTTAGGGNSITYDNTNVAHGNLACQVNSNNALMYLSWKNAMPSTQQQIWFRVFLYFPSIPTFNVSVFEAINGASTIAAVVQINATTGTVSILGNALTFLATTTHAIPTNRWFRIEGFIFGDASLGQVSLSLYTTYDSTTPVENPVFANSVNTAGVMDEWRFGVVRTPGVGHSPQFWMDDPGISNSGYLGPVLYGFNSLRNDNGGCTTQVAISPANNAIMTVGGDVEGLFTTADSGSHWQTADAGVYGSTLRQIASVAYSITENNTIYACVGNKVGGGFLVSTNSGNSWALRSTQVQYAGNHSGGDLPAPTEQSRSTGNLLAQVAGQDLMYTVDYKGGVWRAKGSGSNHGNSWVNIGLSGGTHFGRSIAVDPTNKDIVYASMYSQGLYKATNASTAAPANFALLAGSPSQVEDIVILSSGMIYAACGYGGAGQAGYGRGGLYRFNPGTGTWTQFDSAGSVITVGSYWMSIDGYTDSAGRDQLIIGCNNSAKQGGSSGARTLVWCTVSASGTPTFSVPGNGDLTAVLANINNATIPPENRSWWHANAGDTLGKTGMIQVRPTIDQTTINTNNVSVYVAGSSGFWVSTGNTIGASGPTAAFHWAVSCNGMPLHVAHQTTVDPNDPLHIMYGTSDWSSFDIQDGVAYDSSTSTGDLRPGALPSANGEGFAFAVDPIDSTVYAAFGAKYSNLNGSVWSHPAGNITNWTNLNCPSGPTGANKSTTQVAFGMGAGRDSGGKFLLALTTQAGTQTNAGMWRYSGGSWSNVNSTIGTGGGNVPTDTRNVVIVDPVNNQRCYAWDQSSGLWRSTNGGVSGWTKIWATTNNDNSSGFIALNPAVNNEMWISYSGGLYKIPNVNTVGAGSPPAGTVTIHGVNNNGGIAFAPNGDVYVIEIAGASQPNTRLWVSADGGATWSRADNGSLAYTASNPSVLSYTSNGRIYVANAANNLAFGYPAIPSQVPPSTSLQATATLSALGQDTTGATKFGAVNLRGRATLAASVGGHIVSNLPLQATATLTTISGGTSLLVQQVMGSSTFDYGISTVEMTSTTGNTLVVLAGWDLSTSPTSAAMPAVYVTDSAGNYWYHVTTTSAGVTGSRSSAWICPNANAIEWLSVSLTTFASSLAYTVLELTGTIVIANQPPVMPGLPQFYSLDIADADGNSSASSLALSPGTSTDTDFAFALFTTGAFTLNPTTDYGWQALNSVTTNFGPNDLNPVQIFPYVSLPINSGTSLNTVFTVDQAVPVSGIIFAVHSNVAPPLQLNPNFPVLKVEAAFGFTPGDPSQAPPTWTDITSRCLSGGGETMITVSMGRQYELSVAEAGEITINVDNHDGAFTPGNVNSPYYPNVLLGTPVRVSAFWNESWFSIAYGYVERWPQEWPDMPQWGFSKLVATDAFAALSAVTMFSAADGDILLDAPYLMIPGNEQYTTFTNGLNGFFSSADSQGLLAQNISRVNQRTAMYADGNVGGIGNIIAATGQSTSQLGDSDTGFGTSTITTPPLGPSCGPGIIYTDVNIPEPTSVNGINGVTVSFWVIIPSLVTSASLQPTIFAAFASPSNYGPNNPSLTIKVLNNVGSNSLLLTLADGSTITTAFNVGVNAQHIVLCITSTSLKLYINGAQVVAQGVTSAQVTQWNAIMLGCANYAYDSGNLSVGNFTAFDLAIYNYQLPTQRILSQYVTGAQGQQNVDALVRMAQILSWANLGIPRGGRLTFNGLPDGVTQGPAYSLSGATASDAVNQIAKNHNAMAAAMPSGSLVFMHLWALFNQMPVAIFGDNTDPAQGEVPYLQATSWSYDNTFLYNIDQITQQYGANNLFTVTAADFDSQHAYFTRAALTETIMTMNNLDAYDIANWQINKYSQPSLRINALSVDAASNPQVAFPVILGIQQGQVVVTTRRPMGGAIISENVLIQRISHEIGAATWKTVLQLSPYEPEDSILQLDSPGFNALGNGTLA